MKKNRELTEQEYDDIVKMLTETPTDMKWYEDTFNIMFEAMYSYLENYVEMGIEYPDDDEYLICKDPIIHEDDMLEMAMDDVKCWFECEINNKYFEEDLWKRMYYEFSYLYEPNDWE